MGEGSVRELPVGRITFAPTQAPSRPRERFVTSGEWKSVRCVTCNVNIDLKDVVAHAKQGHQVLARRT